METKIINDISLAKNAILNGDVVAMPTETVYGLAANALDENAVASIFKAKGRPSDNPLIIHIGKFDDVYTLCREVPPVALLLSAAFWPGPLTMVMKKSELVPDVVSAGLDTVGVRYPNHEVAIELIRNTMPLAAPSANVSGRPSTTTAQHVLEDLSGKIEYILEGGASSVGVESTVVDISGGEVRLLRPGGISLEELCQVAGNVTVDKAVKELIDNKSKVSSPGMKYKHYAPKAEMIAVCGDSVEFINSKIDKDVAVLCFDEDYDKIEAEIKISYGSRFDYKAQARRIFDALRYFDKTPARLIYAQCPSETGIGLAVGNRIKKAAGFNVVNMEGN